MSFEILLHNFLPNKMKNVTFAEYMYFFANFQQNFSKTHNLVLKSIYIFSSPNSCCSFFWNTLLYF
jgi:hypothetical protein